MWGYLLFLLEFIAYPFYVHKVILPAAKPRSSSAWATLFQRPLAFLLLPPLLVLLISPFFLTSNFDNCVGFFLGFELVVFALRTFNLLLLDADEQKDLCSASFSSFAPFFYLPTSVAYLSSEKISQLANAADDLGSGELHPSSPCLHFTVPFYLLTLISASPICCGWEQKWGCCPRASGCCKAPPEHSTGNSFYRKILRQQPEVFHHQIPASLTRHACGTTISNAEWCNTTCLPPQNNNCMHFSALFTYLLLFILLQQQAEMKDIFSNLEVIIR